MAIDITTNAVSRYREEVKPQLSEAAAEIELRKLVDMGTIRRSIDWVGEDFKDYVFLLELSDGIAATLQHPECGRCEGRGRGAVAGVETVCPRCHGVGELTKYVVTTVMVRGGMSDRNRRLKAERSARKRRRRRIRRHKPRHDGRPEEDFEPCSTLSA